MANDLTNVRRGAQFDPDSRYQGDAGPVKLEPRNSLDSDENVELLRTLESWWSEARDLHAMNRREQLIDADFYDNDQYTEEDRAAMEERFQAPLVYNIIAPAVDWIVGTERRTRIDFKVLPRGEEDADLAEVKTGLMKYQSDVNKIGWERSKQFKDAVVVGVGWLEEFARSDAFEEPVGVKYADWKTLWWDPHSRDDGLGDARYIHRARYIDLDYALALAPDRAEALQASSVSYLDTDLEQIDDELDVPGLFANAAASDRVARTYRFLGASGRQQKGRQRVRMIETWFRRPVVEKRVKARVSSYDDLNGQMYDTENPDMVALHNRGIITTTDAITDTIWCAIWVPGTLIALKRSPYKHNRFPFTPSWCYRRHRDGMPYGIVRRARDPQEDFNKRRSKALFAMSANQVIAERSAIAEEDEYEFEVAINKPNGIAFVNDGALSTKAVEVHRNQDVQRGHLELMEAAKTQVFEGSGVTRDNLGQDSAATSGRAILAKQQQGAVVTAEVFDNFRLSIQYSGEKLLSLVEQYMTTPRKIRVLGGEGKDYSFLALNQPEMDPLTGEVFFRNDITQSQADFIVDQQDYRETVRMAMAAQMMEMIGKLPPDAAIQLLDLVIAQTDLPNKDEWVRRLRKLNGADQEGVAPTPEQLAAQQAEQARQERAAEAELAVQESKAELSRAQAERAREEATQKRLEGRGKAMDIAGMTAGMIPLAPAADRLYEGAKAPQVNPFGQPAA